MQIESTYKNQGVTVEIRASMIEQDLYFYWAEKFEAMDREGYERFDAFMFIASSIRSIDGIDWEKPTRQTTEAEMKESYLSFMSQVNTEFLGGVQDAINTLAFPSANAVEKPDNTLTEDEKKTTN